MNWYIALVFSLIFFIGGRQLAEFPGMSTGARRTFGMVLAVFALPSFFFPIAYIPGLLASSPWYNLFRSINRVELLSALIAPVAGFATYRKPDSPYRVSKASLQKSIFRVVKPFTLPLCLLFVSVNFAGPLLLPLDKGTIYDNVWTDDGVFVPSSATFSGPAALINAVYVLNNSVEDEKETVKGVYTDRAGAEFWYIARYATYRGCRVSFYKPSSAADIQVPSIISVQGMAGNTDVSPQAGTDMYIALLARSADGVMTVSDPVLGGIELNIVDFVARYGEPGLTLTLSLQKAA